MRYSNLTSGVTRHMHERQHELELDVAGEESDAAGADDSDTQAFDVTVAPGMTPLHTDIMRKISHTYSPTSWKNMRSIYPSISLSIPLSACLQ